MSSDLQRQLDTATAFFLAGERCALELKLGRYGFHTVSAPTITNYALAVELALKLINLLSRDTAETGHNLEALYFRLPADVRQNLMHLSEHVAEIARYFVDWRYPFEKDLLLGDYENPRRAFIECYREIKRLRPQLASVYENLWGGFDPEWIQSWLTEQPRWELRLVGR
ncbi:hypothetical protein [Devosia ginsengisoli]|uniref:hypothetical protein n=1 Tax=Devosia ginsengisoli TaxID=400770 RepID=UPI0026F2B5C4|nr:hypothetical protein [Devosia ginsengisoli]MCR6671794.1 hypothetical protein [Devosia ginsengisoli]